MSILLDPIFNSAAFGHFLVDLLNSQRALLLAEWSAQQGWSETYLAFLSMLYIWSASLSQPVFGWVSDKLGKSHRLAAGGIFWMSILFMLALTLPIHLAVPCLILASFGSAAFHPIGTAHATLHGRQLDSRREVTATSWFFVFGQAGLMVGPMLGGVLLSWQGPLSLAILAIFGFPAGFFANHYMRSVLPERALKGETIAGLPVSNPFPRAGFIALAGIAALQAWAQQNFITFIPRYYSDMGASVSTYGLMIGLFMGGSTLGNVIGGSLADRFGKKPIMMVMLFSSSLPIYIIASIGWSNWLYVLIPLAGFFTGAVHSIIVTLAQKAITSGMALATGLALGFMFSSGALGTLLCGWMADQWGFPLVFRFTSLLVLLAGCLPLFINLVPTTLKENTST